MQTVTKIHSFTILRYISLHIFNIKELLVGGSQLIRVFIFYFTMFVMYVLRLSSCRLSRIKYDFIDDSS